jgi:hypothetical protein
MSADETKIDQDKVWDEHLAKLNVPAHWTYLFGVLLGGFLLMLALMAFLGGGS